MIRLSWFISAGLAIFAVMIVQYFFQLKSETGDLGIVGVALAIPFVILCIFISYKYFVQLGKNNSDFIMGAIYLVFGVLLSAALIYFVIDYKNSVYAELGGGINNPDSKIYGLSALNVETSRTYFNFYTICLIICISAVIGWVSGLYQAKKDK